MAANRIAALRHEADLSQKELGQKLGIVQSAISAWELGRNQPDFAAMRKMARLFHCSIDYLMDTSMKSATRGLSQEDYEQWLAEQHEKREREELEREIAAAEYDPEKDEAYQEYLSAEQYEKWSEVKEYMLFEAFQINELMENMTDRQRKYCLELIEQFSAYCQND